MDINEMIKDFCRRTKNEYTEKQIIICLEDNYHIITEYGFCIFNISYDELYCLFCYVIPNSPKDTFKNLVETMETFAKMNGCTKTKFITRRDKGFSRIMKDYKPCAVMFEKKLESEG